MCSRVYKLVMVIFLSGQIAMANGKSTEGSGGGGHGEANGAPEKGQIGVIKKEKSKYESYWAVLLRVNTLLVRIQTGEQEMKKLISQKHETKDPKKVTEIVQQMIKLHREIEENVREYTLKKASLSYSYPEKGVHKQRKYERLDVMSIEEMEGQFNLTTGIKKAMDKARIQYESPQERNRDVPSAEGEVPVINKPKETLAPSLFEPVIIKK
jgi:hypothetical protein